MTNKVVIYTCPPTPNVAVTDTSQPPTGTTGAPGWGAGDIRGQNGENPAEDSSPTATLVDAPDFLSHDRYPQGVTAMIR